MTALNDHTCNIGKQNMSGGRNVLLVTSAATPQSPFSTSEKRPPIGIGFLISVLRDAGHKVSFLDNYLEPSDFLETDYLQRNSIDFVGIYCNTICLRDTLRMLGKLEDMRRHGKWNGKIMVGGPHTTVGLDTIPDYVDYVVQGEGEQAILDIVEGRVNDRVVCYPRIENLDELPMPAWDYFVKLNYNWGMQFIDDGPVFTMNTSRGCPFKCQFCSVGSIWGKRYTYFSAERVVDEIEYLMKTYGARGIYFREDNFTLNRARLEKFCNLIIERNINISWVCESRVSNLDSDIMKLMARAGLKGFYFGVESGSQRMLDLMEKGITVDEIRNAFSLCHEAKVKTAASMIVGVPGETGEDLAATKELIEDISPDITWVNVFVGIPDSKLYRKTVDNRLYEYIDDRGLVYLKGHNERVKCYYGQGHNAAIQTEDAKKDMVNKPRVSVLLAVHNGQQYIEQALKSIYDQKFQDFEVVIIDDASTDNTAEILLKMKDSRTFIYLNEVNQGLTKSLNIGLRLCRGDYVARHDADDISYPERFAKQVAFMDEHPNCAAVGSWCNRLDCNNNIFGQYNGRPTDPEGLKRGLLEGNCIAHGTAMIRRNAFLAVDGYDQSYTYAQDHDLWLRMSELFELRNMPECLYGLRHWTGNITVNKGQEQIAFSELAVRKAIERQRKSLSQLRLSQNGIAAVQTKTGPKFSVIIANYNNGKYIDEAIESVINQAFRDWELIIVEDCSTDNSLDIIERYLNDNRIRMVQHDRNKGYVEALKTGIDNVGTEYFAILDSDDVLRRDALEIMYCEHVNNPDTGLIYSQYVSCNENMAPMDIGYGESIEPGKTNLDKHVVTALRTFKLSDYKKTNGYDEDILYAEDRDICYKMEEVTKLKFVNEPLYYYRRLSASQSHDERKKVIGKEKREKARLNAFMRRDLKPAIGISQESGITQIDLSEIQSGYQLAIFEFEAGNFDIAEKMLGTVLESITTYLNIGEATGTHKTSGRHKIASDLFFFSSVKLSQCYMQKNEPQKAVRVYEEILQQPNLLIEEQRRKDVSQLLAKFSRIPDEQVVEKQQNQCVTNSDVKQSLVSVVMPVYNGQKYVAKAIASVLNQDYSNYELIFINDGSTDNTEQILRSFDSDKIRYFIQENRGLAASHNEGISRARGEFIIKVDCDDLIGKDFISRHIEHFQKHPDADLVYCDDHLIEQDGKPGRVITRPEYHDRRFLIRDLFSAGFPVIPFRTCIRRSVFQKIGLFDESLFIGEDYDMMRRFVKARLKAVHLPAALYYRRMTDDSLSRQYTEEKAKCQFEIIKSYFDTFSYDELFPDVQWDKIEPSMQQMHAKCLMAMNCIRLSHTYIETSIHQYARAALDSACVQLADCFEQDPGNGRVKDLIRRCESVAEQLGEPVMAN